MSATEPTYEEVAGNAVDRAWFQCDFNGDGVLSLMEAAKGNIARAFTFSTMDKKLWGRARQIRMGVDFTF
jgi:hypothetical protein